MNFKKFGFSVPPGAVEVSDDQSLDLMHFEFRNMKPKGMILFQGEKSEIVFQFFAEETREGGLFAKPVNPNTAQAKRILDYLEKYLRYEAMITVTLMQFRVIFLCTHFSVHYQNGQRFLKFPFPTEVLKMHRRKFIRIPFNDKFPAELRFQTDKGPLTRKLKDLSREGMRIQLEPGDTEFLVPGYRPKQAVLKVLNREMAVGLNVMAVHGTATAGLKIVAISEEDKIWIKNAIRVLMSQILGIETPRGDDQLEEDDEPSNKSD